MPCRILATSLVLYSWVILLAGCAGETLEYETALNLLRDRRTDPITISFSASPGIAQGDPKVREAYDRLVDGHVLICEPSAAVGVLCRPGPAGEGITSVASTDLSLVAGQWVPSVITKINRSARGTANAEARLSFEPSPLYREYQDAFDVLQSSAEAHVSMAQQKEGKSVLASFVRSEDGWHLDNLQ